MADNDVLVTFGANIEGISVGVTQIREILRGLAEPIQGIRENLGDLADTFITAFAVDKIAEFAESMGELGDKTATASAVLGMSTEDVGALGLMAKASGISLEELEGSFSRLSRNLIDQSDPARRALEALGLNFQKLSGETSLQQFDTIADKFSRIKDGAEKTAIAVTLFGRTGEYLTPLLNQGSQGIDSWTQAAKDLGVSLGENVVAQLEETHNSFVKMNAAIEGASVAGFLEFRTAVEGAAEIVTDLAKSFTQSMEAGGELRGVVDGVATSVKELEVVVAILIAGLREVWDAGAYTFTQLATTARDATSIMREAFTSMFSGSGMSGVTSQWEKLLGDLSANQKNYSAEIRSDTQTMMKEIVSIWQDGEQKIAASHQQTTTHMASADRSAEEAQLTTLNAEIDQYKAIEKQKEQLIQEGLKMKTLNAQQGLQATLDALQDELQDAMDVYKQEEALVQGQPAKLAEVLKQEQQLTNTPKPYSRRRARLPRQPKRFGIRPRTKSSRPLRLRSSNCLRARRPGIKRSRAFSLILPRMRSSSSSR